MELERRMEIMCKIVELEKIPFKLQLPTSGSIYFKGTLDAKMETVNIISDIALNWGPGVGWELVRAVRESRYSNETWAVTVVDAGGVIDTDLMGILRLRDILDARGSLPSHFGGEVAVLCRENAVESGISYPLCKYFGSVTTLSHVYAYLRFRTKLIPLLLPFSWFESWKLASDGRVGGQVVAFGHLAFWHPKEKADLGRSKEDGPLVFARQAHRLKRGWRGSAKVTSP
jgi:hypothetical protein